MHRVENYCGSDFKDAIYNLNEQIKILFDTENIDLKVCDDNKENIFDLNVSETKMNELNMFFENFDFMYYYQLKNYLIVITDYCDKYDDMYIYIFDLNLNINEQNAKIIIKFDIILTQIFVYCLIKQIDLTDFEKTKQNIEDLIKKF